MSIPVRGSQPAALLALSWFLLSWLPVSGAAQQCGAISLTQVARRTVEYYFSTGRLKTGSLEQLLREFPTNASSNPARCRRSQGTSRRLSESPTDASQARPAGVFVTLSRGQNSRACWGSLTPGYKDLVTATVYSTVGALTREYRFAPIRPDEWKNLQVQVTVVRSVDPIPRIADQNPLSDGLMVRSGGKSGVLLPGEARDAFYQLVKCKLKAGIGPGEPCQLYRIRADVYK